MIVGYKWVPWDIVSIGKIIWVEDEVAARDCETSDTVPETSANASTGASGHASASTVKFYDALSIVFFISAAASLAFLSVYLITDFVVIALGAMDIGTVLNAASRMIALRGMVGEMRERKARGTVRIFHVISYACYAVAFAVFAVGVVNLDTDFGVMGLELTGCGTILMAISRSIQLESLV